MSQAAKVVLAVFGILATLVIIAWSPWSTLRFHGDGKFTDELFFHPRYWVRFSDVALYEAGEHHFHFRGMPDEELTLVLYVKNRQVDTDADRKPLENLPVTIDTRLTDDKGNVSCRASGRPDPGNRDGVWVLVSGGASGYWHYECNPVQFFPSRTYDLMIRVSDLGPTTERVVVTPTLKGGGIELP